MTAVRTKTFQSGNSEAVRLPKEMAYGIGTEIDVQRIGEVTTIRPAKKSLAWMVEQLRTLPPPEGKIVREFEAPVRNWDR